MSTHELRHIVEPAPRILVVDGSRLVRRLVGDVLKNELPEAELEACAGLDEARAALDRGPVALATTALSLPDGDGLALARLLREQAGQTYVPVIVVSGEAQSRLEDRRLGEDVTDHFDKSLGHAALAAFIRGYVRPEPVPGARVLYVEDSRVVALATSRMLRAQGMEVIHVPSVEEALERLKRMHAGEERGVDLVLTDLYLKGELDGRDLLAFIRRELHYGKRRMPVLVMTGDENPDKQGALLREGANDLVVKPVEERLLVTKALFQLRIARMQK
ncbi:MAG: response regulator [Pseudoxanthomonas suwonensis]|nr:response regulator [Pseudoxanthomonas suwonensis]